MDWFKSDNFDRRVEVLLDEWRVAGLSVAIAQGKKTSSKGYGYATFNPTRACTSDTLFDIASCSKSLTAASVGLLVEDEQKYQSVQWDSLMSDLLPDDFVMAEDSYTQQITVDDILSHRTGFPGHDDSCMGKDAEHPDTPKSITRNLRNLAVSAPLRAEWIYSNIMYIVASYLVEHLSGMTFAEFLHEHFFQPLDMTSSYLQPDAAKAAGLMERLSIPYEWDEKRKTWIALPYEQLPEGQGAGSVWTSVNDYIKYIQAMMYQHAPITDEIYKGVTKLRAIENPRAVTDDQEPFTSPFAYAAGWEIYNYRGHTIVRHDGAIDGYGSTHLFLPDLKFGCVAFANSNPGSMVTEILAKELIDHVLGVPDAERVDWNARAHKTEVDGQEESKNDQARLRNDLCPNGPEPQKLPLSVYTGEYWNAGYRGMKVEIKDDALFIDASKRTSNGFLMRFEHLCGQNMFLAHFVSTVPEMSTEDAEAIKAEFRFDNDRVVKMGLALVSELDDMIWFDKLGPTKD